MKKHLKNRRKRYEKRKSTNKAAEDFYEIKRTDSVIVIYVVNMHIKIVISWNVVNKGFWNGLEMRLRKNDRL